MTTIGIDSITFLAMPPGESVALAAELGCSHVGLALKPMTPNPHGYRDWSLADDAALRKATVAALAAHGIKVGAADGVFLLPGADAAALAPTLDILAELTAPLVNLVTFDPDLERNLDQLGRVAELAAARGLRTGVEFVPGLGVGDLPTALALVRRLGRADTGVTIDPMHLYRSGATAADVAAMAPGEIAHVQICDVPAACNYESYGFEAVQERLAPGDGELPLAELVAALPPLAMIGIEVPQVALAEAGMGAKERIGAVVAKTRALLERR